MVGMCPNCGRELSPTGRYCICRLETETKIPMPKVKPPLGVMPQKYWWDKVRDERVIALNNAMVRYFEANKEIPIDWVKERNELLNKI